MASVLAFVGAGSATTRSASASWAFSAASARSMEAETLRARAFRSARMAFRGPGRLCELLLVLFFARLALTAKRCASATSSATASCCCASSCCSFAMDSALDFESMRAFSCSFSCASSFRMFASLRRPSVRFRMACFCASCCFKACSFVSMALRLPLATSAHCSCRSLSSLMAPASCCCLFSFVRPWPDWTAATACSTSATTRFAATSCAPVSMGLSTILWSAASTASKSFTPRAGVQLA
mmetsp:Transcript_8205/g.25536  ORF Transcript_8205/g.25536 Transcript_8205/m.25536 type:complete len:240 (+) Transcript_8205:300-1019(+)